MLWLEKNANFSSEDYIIKDILKKWLKFLFWKTINKISFKYDALKLEYTKQEWRNDHNAHITDLITKGCPKKIIWVIIILWSVKQWNINNEIIKKIERIFVEKFEPPYIK